MATANSRMMAKVIAKAWTDPAYKKRLLKEPAKVLTAEGVKVPTTGYFVLGDNSPNSMDSRVWGFVEAHFIHGRLVHAFGQESR